MTPFGFFALVVVTMLALVAMWQIPLVTDLITASGLSSSEVFAGFVSILSIFYSMILVFFVKTR